MPPKGEQRLLSAAFTEGATPNPSTSGGSSPDATSATVARTKAPPPPRPIPPKATTIEDDVADEVAAEKNAATVEEDKSPLDTFSKAMMGYLMEEGSGGKGALSGELPRDRQEAEARQRKERQLQAINQRRARSQKKFDLVEDMFTKSVERRMKAMQHIANDPPADRFIGQNMVQHVPAAQLGGEPQRRGGGKASSAPPSAAPDTTTTPPPQDDNAAVFLTELDGVGGATKRTNSPGSRSTGPPPPEEMDEAERAHQVDLHAERWREIGYDVVLVDGASGQALGRTGAGGSKSSGSSRGPTTAPRSRTTGGGGTSKKTRGSAYDEYAWMKLEPLPPVCLVQKRVAAPEDGSVTTATGSTTHARSGKRQLGTTGSRNLGS